MKPSLCKNQAGLTTQEAVVALTAVTVLFIISYFAIDPAARLREARNADRTVAVVHLQELLYANTESPTVATIDSDPRTVQVLTVGNADLECAAVICGEEAVAPTGCEVDVSKITTDPVPYDPVTGNTFDTRYYVNRVDDRFEVGACDPELNRVGVVPKIVIH